MPPQRTGAGGAESHLPNHDCGTALSLAARASVHKPFGPWQAVRTAGRSWEVLVTEPPEVSTCSSLSLSYTPRVGVCVVCAQRQKKEDTCISKFLRIYALTPVLNTIKAASTERRVFSEPSESTAPTRCPNVTAWCFRPFFSNKAASPHSPAAESADSPVRRPCRAGLRPHAGVARWRQSRPCGRGTQFRITCASRFS